MPNLQEKELDVLIRARYPLLYLVSWEETRAEQMLKRIADRHGKNVFFWSLTRGLCDPQQVCNESVNAPRPVLDHIEKADGRTLFVLKDFHPHLQEPVIIRRLRDLVESLKSTGKTVIILAPQLTVPVELEKDITVVDYALPDREELRGVLETVVRASEGGSRFKVVLEDREKERLLQSIMGLTRSEAENALAKAIVLHTQLDIRAIDVVLQEIKQIIRKSRMLEYFEAREDLSAIGGMDVLKEWLHQRGKAFSVEARSFGLPEPRGLLLLGVQGCGKSMACKAIASLWKLPLLRLDMGAVFGSFIGQSEDNIRRAIATAEAVAPCVLWVDEIEKAMSGTGSSNTSDAGTTARVFSTFLTWLQEKTKPVFVAATANNIHALPPELLRKGRLDELFFIDLPDPTERRQIFTIHLAKRKRKAEAFDIDILAAAAAGFSGAEIEQSVISGLYQAFGQNRDLTTQDVLDAVQATVPLSRTMEEEIARLRDWARSRTRSASSSQDAPASGSQVGFRRHG
jgi:SpoVK/Ycf46/Vps4 family AAA+-type ATPase